MTQIEKYIERLKTLQNLYEEGQPQHNAFGIAIVEANEMLVENCSIPDVVGQSEQLVAFCRWYNQAIPSYETTEEEIVETYLREINN